MQQSGLFEGSTAKYFSYDIDMLTEGKYRLAGQLVALSLKYDGPGPQCMHTAVYDAIAEDSVTGDAFTVEDLADGDMKAVLNQVSRTGLLI